MDDLNGSFQIKHGSPGGEQRLTLTFNVEGDSFAGTVENCGVIYEMINCAFVGEEAQFAYVQKTPMGPMKPTHRVKVDGDKIIGKVKLGGPFGSRKYVGERVK